VLFTYLRRRNSAVTTIALSDDDNKRIDALLNAKDERGAL